MGKRGRPTSCTPEVTEQIAQHLRAGQWFVTACALAGVYEQTAHRWMTRGRAEIERVAEDPRRTVRKSEQPFVDFCESCTRARAAAEAKAVMRVQLAGAKDSDGDWRADAWFLERAFPKRWGNQRHTVVHEGGERPVQIEGRQEVEVDVTARVIEVAQILSRFTPTGGADDPEA